MSDRLTHNNLQSNPYAAYLSLIRREYSKEKHGPRFLVAFQVDKVLPLIGAGDEQQA